jgi:glycosyltransferase involved in cell wall biosynthesis
MKELLIVTDQGRRSGIGNYAILLQKGLGTSRIPGRLASMNYIPGEDLPGADVLTRRYAHSPIDIPLTRLLNSRNVRSEFSKDPPWLHSIGADYSLVDAVEQSVCTVHEAYFTLPSSSQGLGNNVRDLWYDMNLLASMRYLRRCTEIIAISHFTARQIEARFRVRITVIQHCVDGTRFHVRNKLEARSILGLPRNRRLLLNVSGPGINKNLATLAAIADRLPPDCSLVKVGEPLSARNVLWFPAVPADQYPFLFSAADYYLHTSTKEGFGRPLIEALSSGLPVISPSCSTGEEILGRNALLVDDPLDVQEYLEKLAMAGDADSYSEFVQYALERAKRFNDFADWWRRHEEVYARAFGINT